MSVHYKPSQDLSFLFRKSNNTLYVKARLNIPVKAQETLIKQSTSSLDKEASIVLKVASTDAAAPKNYENDFLLVLKEHVEPGKTKQIEKLKSIIDDDLNSKGIHAYKIHSKVMMAGMLQVGNGTSTIASNAIIEID
jgi:hypothetical protein